MECKLTILTRALLAVALVAITLVMTYEFRRAGNGKSSLDVQEIRLRPDRPNRKHKRLLTDERQISHGEA